MPEHRVRNKFFFTLWSEVSRHLSGLAGAGMVVGVRVSYLSHQIETVVHSDSPNEESMMIHEGDEEIVGVEFEVCPWDAGLRLFRALAGACLVAGDRGEVSESPPKTPKLGTQEVDEACVEGDAGDVHRCFEESHHQLQDEYRVIDSCGHLQWHGDRKKESFVHQGNIDPEGLRDTYEAQVNGEDYYTNCYH